MSSRRCVLAACLSIALAASPAAAATIGQIDTFEDGTTQGWLVSLLGMQAHPAPPQNLLGGQGGADDNYLVLAATGLGMAGSRLTVLNLSQWAGDYLAEGIGAIAMDVNNFGPTDLALRLLFEDAMGGPPANVAASTNAVLVPAQSGWMSVVFPISLADVTALQGDAATVLSNTTILRIYHGPDLAFPGPPVATRLGVDNIEAQAAAPEPATALLALCAAGAWLRRTRR